MPFANVRPAYAGDSHRPRYHFLPPSGWMNDPNGVIEIDGRYHLFYQHNPDAPIWDKICWGHATSDDLVHWQDQPIALTPDVPGLDERGIWSGCAVYHKGEAILIYTGGTGNITDGLHNMPICGALGEPGWQRWHKLPENPLVPAFPDDGDIVGQRDPVVWREVDHWRMIVGAGQRGRGGAVLLYDSPDLYHWRYLGLLHHDTIGFLWECPQLLTFDDDRAALIVNVWQPPLPSYSAYYSGTYRDGQFEAHFFDLLELNHSAFYAPQATLDSRGRWLMWGWIREERSLEASVVAGWSGVMSLPRVVTMDGEGRLRQQPAPELRSLRQPSAPLVLESPARQGASEDEVYTLGRIAGQMCEVVVEFACAGSDAAGEVELVLLMLPGKHERLSFVYDWARSQLRIVRRRASLNTSDDLTRAELAGNLKIATGEILRLHLFIDHSVIELFANNGQVSATTRVYASLNAGFELGWRGSPGVGLRNGQLWKLNAIEILPATK